MENAYTPEELKFMNAIRDMDERDRKENPILFESHVIGNFKNWILAINTSDLVDKPLFVLTHLFSGVKFKGHTIQELLACANVADSEITSIHNSGLPTGQLEEAIITAVDKVVYAKKYSDEEAI
jgi:hypothetical protein